MAILPSPEFAVSAPLFLYSRRTHRSLPTFPKRQNIKTHHAPELTEQRERESPDEPEVAEQPGGLPGIGRPALLVDDVVDARQDPQPVQDALARLRARRLQRLVLMLLLVLLDADAAGAHALVGRGPIVRQGCQSFRDRHRRVLLHLIVACGGETKLLLLGARWFLQAWV